jgi:hypothetical protein
MILKGYFNGAELSFDFCPESMSFSAEIPRSRSGTYVMELHLTDEAGNTVNECGIIVCIDFDKLSINVLDLGFLAGQESPEYMAAETIEEYICAEASDNYSIQLIPPEFTGRELV